MTMAATTPRSAWLMSASACLLCGQHTDSEVPAGVLLTDLAALDQDLCSGAPDGLIERLLQVLPLAALDSEVRSHVLLRLAYAFLTRLDLRAAESTLQQGADLARTRPNARPVLPLLLALMTRVHLLQQRPERARQSARQALARGQRDPLTRAHAHLAQAQVHRLLGDRHRCLEEYQLAYHYAPPGPVRETVRAFRNLAFHQAGLLTPTDANPPPEVYWRWAAHRLPDHSDLADILDLRGQAGLYWPAVLEELMLRPLGALWRPDTALTLPEETRPRVTLVPAEDAGLLLDGRWISAGGHHAAVSLLLYLHLNGPASSDAVMEALYPDDELTRQRRRLRHHLHAARSLIGDPRAVVTRSGRITLSAAVTWTWSVPTGTRPVPHLQGEWATTVRDLASRQFG